MGEPIWIRAEVVGAIHKRVLAEHGGLEGIRDEGLLQSALSRPVNLLACSDAEPDLAALAAAYAFGITMDHPFIDGSKPTAYVVCRTFLAMNGRELVATQEEKYLTFLQLAEGRLLEEGLADWIREHAS